MYKSIANTLEGTYSYESFAEEARGSGKALWAILVTKETTATTKARNVIDASFRAVATSGIQGELTFEVLKNFVKEYKQAKRRTSTLLHQIPLRPPQKML